MNVVNLNNARDVARRQQLREGLNKEIIEIHKKASDQDSEHWVSLICVLTEALIAIDMLAQSEPSALDKELMRRLNG
jgi:hypothetical protein